jgi:hypothetical protein
MESKKEIYDLIPQQYYPTTILINSGTNFQTVCDQIINAGMSFPMITKPDIGLRGNAVKKLNNSQELAGYTEAADFDFIIQDLIPYKNEIGIFYVRYPDDAHGRITGLVSKEFLVVTGDGKSTIEDLLHFDPRFELQLPALRKEYGERLQEIPSVGEEINLVPYGNHARGAKFIDASEWITPELTKVIDDICLQIDRFYFGRIDLMYDDLNDLSKGKSFSIVEINGAASEPTHIYDPRHTIFYAWRELIRHISYMYEISVINHKKGVPYLSYKEGMKQYRLHNLHCRKICQV